MSVTPNWIELFAPNSRPCGDDSWPKVETGSQFAWRHQTNVGNIGATSSRPTRALNLQMFILSLCRTRLFAILS